MSQYITPAMMLAVVLGVFPLLLFFCYYWSHLRPAGKLPPAEKVTFALPCHPMEKADRLPLLILTLVYAATAFFQLGSTVSPQTTLDLGDGQTVTLDLGDTYYVSKLWTFSGLGTGDINLEISSDGDHWSTLWNRKGEDGEVESCYWADAADYAPSYALAQKYNDLFKWQETKPDNPQYVRYLRLTGRAGKDLLEVAELALFDENGAPIALSLDSPLFDEQDTVPEKPTWYNSAYFDEIYHARTALEHIEGVYPYEVSHPPLGKLILSLGIQLFGMTPFGWRFMGTLFGVLMLPVLYVFLKNLFGKTPVAACGTALFAFDFMHLTQTRIATIDTYGVFFILCMYFFMYRYLTLPAGTSFRRGMLPLFLSGLMWGLGAASKWTVIYGGVGLALVYFIGLYFKWRDWPVDETGRRAAFGPWCGKTLVFSVLCFVLIPVCIYCVSYYPYASAQGDTSLGNLWSIVVENQKFMFTYHEGVTSTHPYSSRWYQWVVDGRPILYYLDNADTAQTGLKAAFGCFNNPLVCWGGLLALITVLLRGVTALFTRKGEGPLLPPLGGRALFLVVGYFSQLAPWFLIGRTTFEYHYFPSTLFLVLILAFVMNELMELRPKGWKGPVYGFTGLSVALYFLFYPVLTGLTVPTWYTSNFLKWLPSWPF